MGKPYCEPVELYLWGAAIRLGRSGHTTICCPLPGPETLGKHNHATEDQTPIGRDTIFSAASIRATEEVPPQIENDGEDEVAANDLETQGSGPSLASIHKCVGALPLGIPNANALRGRCTP